MVRKRILNPPKRRRLLERDMGVSLSPFAFQTVRTFVPKRWGTSDYQVSCASMSLAATDFIFWPVKVDSESTAIPPTANQAAPMRRTDAKLIQRASTPSVFLMKSCALPSLKASTNDLIKSIATGTAACTRGLRPNSSESIVAGSQPTR